MLHVVNGLLLNNDAPVEQIWSINHGGAFPAPPTIAVIHFTAGGTARSSAAWFASPRNTVSSAHVVVDRDGSVIQCVGFDKMAWHAGRSTWKSLAGLNRYAIGVELANWGALRASDGKWLAGSGRPIENPCMAIHRNGNPDGSRASIGWEPYSAAQFDMVVELVRALRAAYPIAEIVGHDDIAPSRKWDPGPAFDMARLNSLVFGSHTQSGWVHSLNAVQG